MQPRVILNLDMSASYLIVTDSNRKVHLHTYSTKIIVIERYIFICILHVYSIMQIQALLVLQLSSSAPHGDASVTSVTEYLLTQPVLSFTVSSCVPLPAHAENEDFSGEESGEEEEEEELDSHGKDKNSASVFDSRRNTVLIELHCVHTRYVCHTYVFTWVRIWEAG